MLELFLKNRHKELRLQKFFTLNLQDDHIFIYQEYLLHMFEISYVNWKKQANQGLCDFKEISKMDAHKFRLCGSGIIYRNFQDYSLIFVPKKKKPTKNSDEIGQPLFCLTENDDQYKITDIKNDGKDHQWLTILAPKNQQKQCYLHRTLNINQDSIIKAGKVLLKVQKFKTRYLQNRQSLYKKLDKELMEPIRQVSKGDYIIEGQQKDILGSTLQVSVIDSEQLKKLEQSFSYSQDPVNPICKICYSRTFQEDNKLISLCRCTGSTKFIHQNCLKKWVKRQSQLTIEKKCLKSVYVASMKGFICQICKQTYPLDNIIQLFFNQNQNNKLEEFIAISVHNMEKQLLYIINLQKLHEIKIGRDLTNDIIINDMSVSRQHCIIKYNKQQKTAELIDLDSKFGTGIKKSSIVLTQKRINVSLKLQKGRTFMQIFFEKSKKSFFSNFKMCNYE